MSAQLGASITLGYGAQGAQQAGSAVLLSYSPPEAVSRKLVAAVGSPWGAAHGQQRDIHAPMHPTEALQLNTRARWAPGQLRNVASRQPWGVAQRMDAARRNAWLHFAAQPLGLYRGPWGVAQHRDHAGASPWSHFTQHLALHPVVPWGVAHKQDAEQHDPWGQFASYLARSAGASWPRSVNVDREQWHPWTQFSRTIQAPWSVVLPDGTVLDTFYILPARFYMTTHTIFAETLPGLAEVPIYDATVSTDAGSYCWSLSASGPASLFAQLAPVDGMPVQLRLWLDGLPWVFAIDSIRRSQGFGKTGVSISGRSVTALIGAPYLRATTRDNAAGALTAQQLALAALATTGIDLDWGLTDWLVPAGAWSHQGTPLDAAQAIAQAAGGYLQSHRSAATLLARHAYGQRAGDNSGAPWSWMTGPADVELAPDAIITDGTERKDGADINAVYVSGTTQGVLAQVKRSGTAGDKLAAMVTDALITHTDAARQRGLAVLGAAGAKYNVRLELPVLTGAGQPGVLDVGQLVQINAATPWRGRVRAVSVNAKRPSLRQTVTLERHLEIA